MNPDPKIIDFLFLSSFTAAGNNKEDNQQAKPYSSFVRKTNNSLLNNRITSVLYFIRKEANSVSDSGEQKTRMFSKKNLLCQSHLFQTSGKTLEFYHSKRREVAANMRFVALQLRYVYIRGEIISYNRDITLACVLQLQLQLVPSCNFINNIDCFRSVFDVEFKCYHHPLEKLNFYAMYKLTCRRTLKIPDTTRTRQY